MALSLFRTYEYKDGRKAKQPSSRPAMIRAWYKAQYSLGLVCTVLLLITLVGCGSGASGPTTEYDDPMIHATLPGDDWHSADITQNGALTTDEWENEDRSMIFRVSVNPDEILSTMVLQSWAVEEYISVMDYPESFTADRDNFRGYRAMRLEAVYPGKDAYHLEEYVFVVGVRHYFVGAGSTNANWDKGGREAVERIINSVQIK